MNRQIALWVAFAATIIVAACSATRVPSPAPMNRGPALWWLLVPSLEPRTTASSAEAAGVVE